MESRGDTWHRAAERKTVKRGIPDGTDTRGLWVRRLTGDQRLWSQHLEVDVTELSEEGGPSLRECERINVLVKLTRIRARIHTLSGFFCMKKSIIRRELKNTWHTNPSTLQNNGKINFFKDILYLHPSLKDSATSSRQMTKLLLRCKHIKWVLLGQQQLIDKIDYYW